MSKLNANACPTGSLRTCRDGFSIIEILIAMVIFLIVTGSIFGLLQIARIDRNRSSRNADVLKNARIAVHLIGRDALNAGLGFHRRGAVVPDNFLAAHLSVPPDEDNQRDILTSIVAGNNIHPNNLNSVSGARTDLIAFAYRDLDFNDSEVVNLQNAGTPGGTPQIARLQTTTSNGARNVRVNDLYLIESDTSQVAVLATGTNSSNQIDIAPNDALGLNQPHNGIDENGSLLRQCVDSADQNCTTYLASMKRFFWVKYHVSAEGTLIRTVYGNNRSGTSAADQRQEFPLAYNIEDLQIKYVLKNGIVTENPGAGADGVAGNADDDPEDLNQIRQITITLKVQALEADEQTRKYETFTISATFSARNLEYDAG